MADLERTRPGDIVALARLTQRLKRAVADERLALNELDKEEQRLNDPLEKQSRGTTLGIINLRVVPCVVGEIRIVRR